MARIALSSVFRPKWNLWAKVRDLNYLLLGMSSFKLSVFEVLRSCFTLFSNQLLHTIFHRLSFQCKFFQTFRLNFQPPFLENFTFRCLSRTLKPPRFEFYKNGEFFKFGIQIFLTMMPSKKLSQNAFFYWRPLLSYCQERMIFSNTCGT